VTTKPSKFSSIFEANEEPMIQEVPKETSPAVVPVVETPPAPTAETAPTEVKQGSSTRRTGRTTGKKSDPNYRQVTAYVRRDLYKEVSDTLYDQSRGYPDAKRKEFSELVDDLLDAWLQERSDSK
jgi:cell pole-organizing protein PopZ